MTASAPTGDGTRPDYRLIIFDFGGVVMDMGWDLMAELERRYGLPEGTMRRALYRTPEWAALQVGRCTHETYAAAVERELARAAGRPVPECYAEWRAVERPLNRDVVALIEALRRRYRVALLSNADERLESVLRERYGIAHLFDPLIVSACVGLAKPDPAVYLLTAERAGVPPQACVFVDDHPKNAAAAGEVGMLGIHFTGYEPLVQALRGNGLSW
jgi:putative hydrolase of the HAD superfamily